MSQYIHFRTENDDFIMPISDVREILSYRDIVGIPRAHPDLDGVTSLRDSIIPILNLRQILLVSEQINTKQARIILTQTSKGLVGIRVNEVRQIIHLNDLQISEMPSLLKRFKVTHLSAIARYQDTLIKLITPDKLFENYDLASVIDAAGTLDEESLEALKTAPAAPENGRTLKPESKTLSCEHCGKTYKSAAGLRRHMISAHPETGKE